VKNRKREIRERESMIECILVLNSVLQVVLQSVFIEMISSLTNLKLTNYNLLQAVTTIIICYNKWEVCASLQVISCIATVACAVILRCNISNKIICMGGLENWILDIDEQLDTS
jgi:hypothetical protein